MKRAKGAGCTTQNLDCSHSSTMLGHLMEYPQLTAFRASCTVYTVKLNLVTRKVCILLQDGERYTVDKSGAADWLVGSNQY